MRERQAAVTELREQLDLREDLAVLGADVGVGVNPDALADWAESANQMTSLWIGSLAPWLAAAAIAVAVVWAVWGVATPFVVVVVVEAILTWRLRHALDDVLHGAEHAFRDLDLLSGVLARVERHGFELDDCRRFTRALFGSRVGVAGDRAIANSCGPDQLAA